MNINESTLHRVQNIGHELLEVSDINEFRDEVINHLSQLFSASTSAFFNWADARGMDENLRRDDIHFWQLPSEYQDIYFQNVFLGDPLSDWILGRRKFGATAISVMISEDEFKTTALYRQVLQPNKQKDILVISFVVNQRLLGHISLTRHQNASLFRAEDIQLANLLAPVLSAAYSEHLTRRQYAKQDNIVDILASLFPGRFFLLLNESRELVYCNNNVDDAADLQPHLLESLLEKLNIPAGIATHPSCPAPHNIPCWDMGLVHSLIQNHGKTVLSTAFRHHVITHNGRLFHLLRLDASQDELGGLARTNRYGLTKREIEVIAMVKEGLNSAGIGKELSISPWTVKNHLQSIYGKVGVSDRVSLAQRFS